MNGEIIKSWCSKSIIVLLLISFNLISPVLCQITKPASTSKNNSQEQLDTDRWKNLAEEITNDLLDDIKSDSVAEQPVLLAHLAGLWWKIDNESADKWLKKAVSDVTFEPITETEFEKQKRFETAGKLTEFVVRLDKQLAKKLIEDIAKQLEKIAKNPANADSLVKTAIQVVKYNPETAKVLGSKSLHIGQSYLISQLIGELNIENPALATRLFTEALVNSRRNFNLESNIGFISSLATLAFNNYKGTSLSVESKKELLVVLFDIVNVGSTGNGTLQKSCDYVFTASGLIGSYETYYLEKAVFIRQQADTCKTLLKSSTSLIESNLEAKKPQSVDEYLKAAEDTKDKVLKKNYFYRAIEKLYAAKEFEQIITVLDNMGTANRDAFGESSWSSWRATAAGRAAVEFAKQKDFANVYRIINNTPKSIRPVVQISVAKEFANADRPFAISLLDATRKDLNSLEIEDKARAGLNISILRICSEIAPYEAVNVLAEMVKAINKTDENNPDSDLTKDYAPFTSVILLPISLLEIDEFNTLKILSDIKSVNSRVRFRLGFLEQSLKELEKAKLSKQTTKKPPTENREKNN